MKKLQILFLLITPILFSQTKTLKSNLEGLVLEIGDTFLPKTVIVNSNGKETACQTVIYYNKKGVFNIGGSIVQDPVSGKIVANESGDHEVVAVCVDPSNNGFRLSKTFIVSVNYTKTKSIDFDVDNEVFVGNYLDYDYSVITDLGNSRNDVVVNITSSKPEIISVDSNGLVKGLKKGESKLTIEFNGVETSKNVSVIENPVKSVNFTVNQNSVRTGDVVTLNSIFYDKKGKSVDNIKPTYSYSG